MGQPLIDFPFSDLQPKLNHLKKEVVKGVSWKCSSFGLDCFGTNVEVYGIDNLQT